MKAKQIMELMMVVLVIFLIIIVFVMLFPQVSSANLATPLIILFELSPYILMVLLVVMVANLKKASVSAQLGFNLKHIGQQLLIAGLLFAITISFIVVPLLFGANKADVLSFKANSPLILVYYIVKSIVFIGLGEELVMRGYIFEKIKKISGSGIWAVILSSVLFGLWHYPNGQNIAQVFMTGFLGSIYALARLKFKHGSTLATGLAHGLHDATILILSYFLL